MEETRRRNEASMARKRANAKAINPAAANAALSSSDSPLSPSSTGAMDSLLEKLRAAAPQARDQRDRRRRARLKDRHQIRVASGQTIPDMGDLTNNGSDDEDGEKALLSPAAATKISGDGEKMEPISEGEDIADRAASMLQGLRGDGEPSENNSMSSRDGSGSLRIRRRRESANVERSNRRQRRMRDSVEPDAEESKLSAGTGMREMIAEEDAEDGADEDTILADDSVHENKDTLPPPPKTVISPPSPEPGVA